MYRFTKSLCVIVFISILLCGCEHNHWSNPFTGNSDVQFWSKAVKTHPNDAKAHWFLGASYEAQGQITAAEAQYRTVIRLQPNSASGHYALGCLLKRKGQYSESREELKKALKGNWSLKKKAREALNQLPPQ